MVTNASYNGVNSGIQVAENYGTITANLSQQETLLDQACLRDLRTTNPHDDKERIKETNGGLLEDSYRWILDNEAFKQWRGSQDHRLMWVRGDPGKGKTMLLCGIIEELIRLHGDTATISFFFCQATDMRINSAASVLRGLIYSLVENNRPLLRHVRARYDPTGKELFEDINAWSALKSIFTEILEDLSLKGAYLVIDALDECQNGREGLLDLILKSPTTHPETKWVISSRNKDDIVERLHSAPQIASISLELNEASVSDAVNAFIQNKVDCLTKEKRYDLDTREIVRHHLLFNSQATFLWVALVWKSLNRTPRRHVIKKLKLFPPGLDALYHRMIAEVRDSDDAEVCKQILGTVLVLYRPITLSELGFLMKGRNDDLDNPDNLPEIIAACGSFLSLREQTVVFVHQSAKEFLLRESLTEVLPNGIESEHHALFCQSLEVLNKLLRRDIFDIKLPGFPTEDIKTPSPNPLAPANYASIYWVDHLYASKYKSASGLSQDDKFRVDRFLQRNYLHWLESLSILKSLSNGIQAVKRLGGLIQGKNDSGGLLERVRDAARFIQYHRTGIESSPLQVYCSSLIFSPSKSLTRKAFDDGRPDWVVNSPQVEEDWSACLQTLEGHSASVWSLAWSPDGSRLASGSFDNTVRIWDPATGQSVSTLKGHTNSVSSTAWSPDGSRLASASFDRTVRVWVPATGQKVSTLDGHSNWVYSIAWSLDGSRIASASDDSTVRIWDPATGQSIFLLDGHNNLVRSITWSPDGSRLASASSDNTIRIWDPATGQSIFTLKGHSALVGPIAWSPDGSRLASGSFDNTVRIWDPATGQSMSLLEGHTKSVSSIAWSPDGFQLASGSGDNIVRIWDSATGQSIFTLNGHSDWVQSIIWSPDGSRLASGSGDNTVRIWDPATGQNVSTLEGHSNSISSVAWSPDGSRLASTSRDCTIRIWDPAAGQGNSALKRHGNSITSIAWSPDGSRLASGSRDTTVRVWDPATGQSVSSHEGHSDWVYSIAWSPDGNQIASASGDNTVQIWDPATGQGISTLRGHSASAGPVAWSPDGSRLASTSRDYTVWIWDLVTSHSVSTLEGHSDWVRSIAWSPDGSRLASGSFDNTVRIWDLATGQSVSTLEGHSDWVRSIAWSSDGSRLASVSGDNKVWIWDPVTGQSVSMLPTGPTSFVEFDIADPNYLHTDAGIFLVGSVDAVRPVRNIFTHPSKQFGYGLSDDRSWITYNGLNLLWLPSEYRPLRGSLFAIHKAQISFVCSSNRVVFLILSRHCPVPT